MDDSANNELAESLADLSVQDTGDNTAAPEPELSQETAELQPEETTSRTYTQEEVDALIGKRLAKQQRKFERIASHNNMESKPQNSVSQEHSDAEYDIDELVNRKAEELVRQREEKKHKISVEESFSDREEDFSDKHDDYYEITRNRSLPVTDVMSQAILEAERGPDILYYLGVNVKEAQRISKLSPVMQVKELGKIEARLESDSPPIVKKSSAAPAPIKPVVPKAPPIHKFETTDPRSTESMSVSEWIEAERQRQIRLLEAKNKR